MEVEKNNRLGRWLEGKLKEGHLSLRGASLKTDLSHSTIRDIRRGVSPSSETIRKLAEAFADGTEERLWLEDHLLILAGYRTERPEERLSESMARLRDMEAEFNDPQVEVMISFAKFLKDLSLG